MSETISAIIVRHHFCTSAAWRFTWCQNTWELIHFLATIAIIEHQINHRCPHTSWDMDATLNVKSATSPCLILKRTCSVSMLERYRVTSAETSFTSFIWSSTLTDLTCWKSINTNARIAVKPLTINATWKSKKFCFSFFTFLFNDILIHTDTSRKLITRVQLLNVIVVWYSKERRQCWSTRE